MKKNTTRNRKPNPERKPRLEQTKSQFQTDQNWPTGDYPLRSRILRSLHEWVPVLNLLEVIILLIAAYTGIRAFHFYSISNHVAIREQLNQKYDRIADREAESPELYIALFAPPIGVSLDSYVAEAMSTIDPVFDFSKVNHIREIEEYIFSVKQLNLVSWQNANRIYLHAEDYLYNAETTFEHAQEGSISWGEAGTWLASIDQIGVHPLFLLAVLIGHDQGYYSQDFARELQARLYINGSEYGRRVIERYYPEMITADWADIMTPRN